MKTRIVTRNHISQVVAEVGIDRLMDQMIEGITIAIGEFDASQTLVRTRDGFHYTEPQTGLLEWMPVLDTAQTVTVKVVGYHPANPSLRNLPTILSTISVYETDTGHLAGLVDGTFLTALRTGAVSAVASRILARPDSSTVGLVGCGAQAITQLHGLMRTFAVEQVLFHDTAVLAAASFPDRIARFVPNDVDVRRVSLESVVTEADIMCTSTSIGIGAGPLFEDFATKPWLHVNAVGSDFAGKFELPLALLRRSLVCPDNLEQAMKEGECQQLEIDEIGPALDELVAHPEAYRRYQQRTTVYDSTGWALQDQVAVRMMLDHASRLDLGLLVALEDISDDPLNPYDFAEGVDVADVATATDVRAAS